MHLSRPLPRRRFLGTVLVLAGLAGGCATSGAPEEDGTTRGNQNHIVQDELAALHQLSAYQAVERLRPRWLRSRLGRRAQVVVGGTPGQELNVLQTIRATDVREMRFISASDATTRYGTGYDGGAILVTMKGG